LNISRSYYCYFLQNALNHELLALEVRWSNSNRYMHIK